ncbi:MAG: hypothetical protein ABFD79_17520 [Phycisphaerales bacterium]
MKFEALRLLRHPASLKLRRNPRNDIELRKPFIYMEGFFVFWDEYASEILIDERSGKPIMLKIALKNGKVKS